MLILHQNLKNYAGTAPFSEQNWHQKIKNSTIFNAQLAHFNANKVQI